MPNTLYSYYIIADDDLLQTLQEKIRLEFISKDVLKNSGKCRIIGSEEDPKQELINSLYNASEPNNALVCLHARFFGDLEKTIRILKKIEKKCRPKFPKSIWLYSRAFDASPIKLPEKYKFLENGGRLVEQIRHSIENKNTLNEIPAILDNYVK